MSNLTQLKVKRALAINGTSLLVTASAIVDASAQEADALSGLTSKQLAAVMRLVEANFRKGRESTGAEVVDGAVWVDAIGKLLPLSMLDTIEVSKEVEYIRTPYNGRVSQQVKEGGRYADPARAYKLAKEGGDVSHLYTEQRWDKTIYRMPDYQERI